MSANSNSNTNGNTNSYPPPAQAYYALAVLLLAYILSFIDRNILAILVGPIRSDFAISDVQFSLLHGWAFTLFYIFLGLPIAWLADRFNRKWIVITGVFFWSLMTCLCGWANSFLMLFLVRIGVGIGEAALSPPTYSMLSDFFTPRRLPWATAVFSMGITLGSGLSYKVGAWAYRYFTENPLSQDSVAGQLLAGLSAWQITFVAVGLPGLLIVVLLFFVTEPPRIRSGASYRESATLAQIKQHAAHQWQAYTALTVGLCLMSIIGYGTLTWFAEFLIRSYHLSRSDAGNALGNVFIVAGTAGSLSGAFFAAYLRKKGHDDANLRQVMLAAGFSLLPAVLSPLMPDSRLSVALAAVTIFFHYTHFGVAMAALQLITPNIMRAQVSAALLFLTNLFGLALGGTIVASVTDFVFADDQALRYSLAIVAAFVYSLAVITVRWGLPHYRRALAAAAT